MAPLFAKRLRVDHSFERMYRTHVAAVYHYALGVLGSRDEAEDVTHAAFRHAWQRYSRGHRPRSPRGWLIGIVHDVSRQRVAKSSRRHPSAAAAEDPHASSEWRNPSARDIGRALNLLAFNERSALVMRELEGRSYAEIGEILGLQRDAVERLIFRSRRALREELERSLTCFQAELALSRRLDARLPRSERMQVRAHLRSCSDCEGLSRVQAAQRAAVRSISASPLPASLAPPLRAHRHVARLGSARVVTIAAAAALVAAVACIGQQRGAVPSIDTGSATSASVVRASHRDDGATQRPGDVATARAPGAKTLARAAPALNAATGSEDTGLPGARSRQRTRPPEQGAVTDARVSAGHKGAPRPHPAGTTNDRDQADPKPAPPDDGPGAEPGETDPPGLSAPDPSGPGLLPLPTPLPVPQVDPPEVGLKK